MKICGKNISKLKQKFKKTNLRRKRSAKKISKYPSCSIKLLTSESCTRLRKGKNKMWSRPTKGKSSERWRTIVNFTKADPGIQGLRKKISFSSLLLASTKTCHSKTTLIMSRSHLGMGTPWSQKCTELISTLRINERCTLKLLLLLRPK